MHDKIYHYHSRNKHLWFALFQEFIDLFADAQTKTNVFIVVHIHICHMFSVCFRGLIITNAAHTSSILAYESSP